MKKDNYRLAKYLHLPDDQLQLLDQELFSFLKTLPLKVNPKSRFGQYKYLGAGWEWSVFKKNDETVIKIPSGIFLEVNSSLYLQNTMKAYELFCHYFPSSYIAFSSFSRVNGLNTIEQEYIEGINEFMLCTSETNINLFRHMQIITRGLIDFLDEQETIPDIGFEKTQNGYRFFRNILLDKNSCPRLVDFTAYYDPFRIYPGKKLKKIELTRTKLAILSSWLQEKLERL